MATLLYADSHPLATHVQGDGVIALYANNHHKGMKDKISKRGPYQNPKPYRF